VSRLLTLCKRGSAPPVGSGGALRRGTRVTRSGVPRTRDGGAGDEGSTLLQRRGAGPNGLGPVLGMGTNTLSFLGFGFLYGVGSSQTRIGGRNRESMWQFLYLGFALAASGASTEAAAKPTARRSLDDEKADMLCSCSRTSRG
jgi:hypothetical protein